MLENLFFYYLEVIEKSGLLSNKSFFISLPFKNEWRVNF